jgi:hypothetical protein
MNTTSTATGTAASANQAARPRATVIAAPRTAAPYDAMRMANATAPATTTGITARRCGRLARRQRTISSPIVVTATVTAPIRTR